MDERVIQFRVGVVVLSAGLITVILIFLFGEGWTPRYTIYLKYTTAQGVSANTPVRKNGILIGRVTHVELTDDGVELTAKIDQDIKLYENEVCQIENSSLIGDPFLNFMPPPEDAGGRGNLVKDGGRITKTGVAVDPLGQMTQMAGRVDQAIELVIELGDDLQTAFDTINTVTLPKLNNTVDSIGAAGTNISEITNSINLAMGGEAGNLRSFFDDIRTLTATTNQAVKEFETVMINVNDVIGDEELKADIADAMNRLPLLIEQADSTLVEAENTLAAFGDAADSADANLRNLEGITGPLGENGPEMVASLQASLEAVSQMAVQLEAFTKTLNDSEGTVSLLLNDPELYYSFLRAMENVENITQSVRPIMNNLQIASDKIARDPFQLGVRGAFNRSPVGTGSKGRLWSPNNPWVQ